MFDNMPAQLSSRTVRATPSGHKALSHLTVPESLSAENRNGLAGIFRTLFIDSLADVRFGIEKGWE